MSRNFNIKFKSALQDLEVMVEARGRLPDRYYHSGDPDDDSYVDILSCTIGGVEFDPYEVYSILYGRYESLGTRLEAEAFEHARRARDDQ